MAHVAAMLLTTSVSLAPFTNPQEERSMDDAHVQNRVGEDVGRILGMRELVGVLVGKEVGALVVGIAVVGTTVGASELN